MKLDVISNFIAAAWLAVIAFVSAPIYVHYLGVTVYGLIGLLAALQASLGLLDLGLSQVLARELARHSGGGVSARAIRDLVRSVEIIAVSVAVLVALAIVLPSSWIAQSWLKPGESPIPDLAKAIQIMGVLVALRLLEGVYRGAIIGIHRQIALNFITVVSTTAKLAGAVLIFVYVSTSAFDFFLWQTIVSAITVSLLGILLYANLPDCHLHGSFSLRELRRISRFSTGLTIGSVLSIALTQTDKLLLSKLLLLREFGQYSLAATLAAAPQVFATPIAQAVQPRLARALAVSDTSTLKLAFHAGSQLLTVTVGSASVVIIFFSGEVLALWLRDASLASHLAPIVSLLAIGSLLNSFLWLPYALQLAHGWTGLTVRMNIASVMLLVPCILIVVPIYGAIGAASLWVALNLGIFAISPYLMFRRILSDQRRSWYLSDIAFPLLGAIAVAFLCRILALVEGSFWRRVIVIALISIATITASALAAPLVRNEAMRLVARLLRPERKVGLS